MKKIALPFLFLLLTLTTLSAQKKTAPDKRLAGLDTMIQRVRTGWHAAGCGVAVVEKGKVLYAGGFGFSVRFELDEKGHSKAVNFIQPNGTFKAVRK